MASDEAAALAEPEERTDVEQTDIDRTDIDSESGQPRESRVIKDEAPGAGTEYLSRDVVPPKGRWCTDVICCCLFIVALTVMVSMNVRNFKQQNPFRILYPMDHAGNTCGLGDMKEYPKVYYPARKMMEGGPLATDVYYANPENLWAVCTKECPTTFTTADREGQCYEKAHTVNTTTEVVVTNVTNGSSQVHTAEVQKTHSVCTWYSDQAPTLFLGQYCIYGNSVLHPQPDKSGTACYSAKRAVEEVQLEAYESLDHMGSSTNQYLHYLNDTVPEVKNDPEMVEIMHKIEQDTDGRVDTAKTAVRHSGASNESNLVTVCEDAVGEQKSFMTDFFADVVNAWRVLIISAVIGLSGGICYLLLMCYFIKPVVWGSCLLLIVGFGIAGWLFWDESIKLGDTGLVKSQVSETKILAVTCWLLSFIILVIVAYCRRSLQLAVAISTATSGFLMKNIGTMLMPCVLCVMQMVFLMYWIVGLTGILSTAEVKPADNMTKEYNRYVITDSIKLQVLYQFLVGFWVHGFLEGITVIAASIGVTEWYYTPKNEDGEKHKNHLGAFKELAKAFFYHSGSAAFGSLVVAICQTLRQVLILYTKTVETILGKKRAKYLMMCCKCCLLLMAKYMKFVNFNSYLMVGMSGKNFFSSCREVFNVVSRNPVRFAIVRGVMWTLNIVGRVLIMGLMFLWGALLLNKNIAPSLSEDVHSPWPPLIAVLVLGYIIGGLIFGLFTTAGASLFYNFVCDEEISSITGEDPEDHAPGEMGKLLASEYRKRSKKENEQEIENADAESAYEAYVDDADKESPSAGKAPEVSQAAEAEDSDRSAPNDVDF